MLHSWLRNLIAAGLIALGDVDERSIKDVQADDLRSYTQCHFFAGIGGWSYALRLAGWPDERPVWTGSCPCQPFSVAGKQGGFSDERHLWPEWYRLIRLAQPSSIFGEQVANAASWLSLVRGNLEALGYAVGCLPIQAASADAEHFRDRYWFVAFIQRAGSLSTSQPGIHGVEESTGSRNVDAERQRETYCHGSLAYRNSKRLSFGSFSENKRGNLWKERAFSSENNYRLMVNNSSIGWGEEWTEHEFRSRGFTAAVASISGRQYFECPDGKWRRLPPPGVRWLGTGLPSRVAKIRALGNAIDPRPAAAFITAAMGCAP